MGAASILSSIKAIFVRPSHKMPERLDPMDFDMDVFDTEDEEDEELLLACEIFMGARGGNADQREAYSAMAIDRLLLDPAVSEDRKALLRKERTKLNPKPFLNRQRQW